MNKDYFDEQKVRADLARQAQKKKCHGKRPKLPSDGMSKKELMAMNGAVVTMTPNKPMRYAQFKLLPDHLKKEYLQHLITTYEANGRMLGEMFGITSQHVNFVIKELGLPGGKAGKRVSREAEEAWKRFLGVQDAQGEELTPAEETVEQTPAAEAEAAAQEEVMADEVIGHYGAEHSEPSTCAEEMPLQDDVPERNESTLDGLDLRISGNIAEIIHRLFMMSSLFGVDTRYRFRICADPIKEVTDHAETAG